MNRPLARADLPTPFFQETDRKERLLEACPAIESIFRRQAEERHIPGVAYRVILDGELIFTQSLGVRQATTQDAVDANTVFRIASMTKSFAALAIMQLRDAGQLRLDETAATYVPELKELSYPTTDSSLITVRHLLSMAAGWPQDDPWADRQLYQTDSAMSEFYRAGVSWSNPPGVLFEYSNYGYMVLGRIITNVSGMPAVDYINGQILQPLGMSATVWNAADVPAEHLAYGHRWEDDQWKEEPLLPTGGDVAAFAGLFTSVHDLTHWVALFQSAWPPRDEPDDDAASLPLSRASLREMQRVWTTGVPSVTVPGLAATPELWAGGYGCGLSVTHNGQWESVGHGGGLPGFGSHMRWVPEYGIGIVALANVTYANVSASCVSALETLIKASGVQPRTRPIAPALNEAKETLLTLVDQWDDEVADRLFADNFFLDMDKVHWQQALADLHDVLGDLTPDSPLVAENWLRGTWRMVSQQGWASFSITLAPTVPPRIQTWHIETTIYPSEDLEATMNAVALLINQPSRPGLESISAEQLDLETSWDQLRLANIMCGPVTIEKPTGGDGETWASCELSGPKGKIDAKIVLDSAGKLTELTLRPLN